MDTGVFPPPPGARAALARRDDRFLGAETVDMDLVDSEPR
jgi:hypothetical protein